jgi:mannan endo-1,4-beta-mannosidase
MRLAQKGMAAFTKLIDWQNFQRKNMNEEVQVNLPAFAVFACTDDKQAVLWLLRKDSSVKRTRVLKTLNEKAEPLAVEVSVPGMAAGNFSITLWNTQEGKAIRSETVKLMTAGNLIFTLPQVATDVAVAVRLNRP